MSASLAVFTVGALILAAVSFAGGWLLGGLWDRHRAEVARDRAVDEKWERDKL